MMQCDPETIRQVVDARLDHVVHLLLYIFAGIYVLLFVLWFFRPDGDSTRALIQKLLDHFQIK